MAELNINDMETGIEIIAKERRRQIEEEGYTSENDDKETDGELSDAASIYAMRFKYRGCELKFELGHTILEKIWPWSSKFYKPSKEDIYTIKQHTPEEIKDRIHELAKAGALITAEIDRLLRLKDKDIYDYNGRILKVGDKVLITLFNYINPCFIDRGGIIEEHEDRKLYVDCPVIKGFFKAESFLLEDIIKNSGKNEDYWSIEKIDK